MTKYNLTPPSNDPSINYSRGLLPQRNQPGLWYEDTSCRSNLTEFKLSSENKRIIKITDNFKFSRLPLSQFKLSAANLQELFSWTQQLGWDFPKSSIRNVFSHHIFNQLYLWKRKDDDIPGAFAVCYFGQSVAHIAYVFYHPSLAKTGLPIRLVLQCVIDSHDLGLTYCYLGRFSHYKRNLPGFECYQNQNWVKYHHYHQ